MPFTPSHAVVALPFVRSPLIPAAIGVGAMAPDLPLFVRGVGPDYDTTHDLRWVPLTAVVALVLLLAWRAVLRPATRELSPRWLASRLPDDWDAPAAPSLRATFAQRGRARASWRGGAILAISLVVGVVSHIVWDLFTHEGRWGSEVLPALDDAWGPLTGYKWLQHGSSAIGLVILAVWGMGWLKARDAAESLDRVLPAGVRWAWWASLPATLMFAWGLGLSAYGPFTAEWTIAHLAYRVLPPACAVWACATLLLCAAIQALRVRRAS
ncbi:DUF4184 family protein [Microbacterium rhizomatis]|uniref:DUF4184 family protein n=1 Tax=Microbacterium rhizomatis TaxID=1631477 RepID=A0A5J5J4H7_9MICO|nr:DUF4184 family protein [Microbacterium rhizomatis]KAA9110976.1 DUF4184 family protein [Microbacterium rhizomatis]